MKDLFILKTVHDSGEFNVCLGESYSKIHLTGVRTADNAATSIIIDECKNYIEETDSPFDTLDFIVSEDGNVHDLSTKPWGFEDGVKCYYITLGGNTVDKIVPKEYDKEELDTIWHELIDDPDVTWGE